MTKIRPHQRVNDILLAPLERPALKWFAVNMPAWVNPDILTFVGIIGALLTFTGYLMSNYRAEFLWLASLGFVINWFGDSLDGTLARHRQIERPKYGFFVDHTVDAFNEVIIVIGLGLSPYINFSVACLALIGYLLMSVLVYIRTYINGIFQLSYGKFGPTEVRVILILMNATMFYLGIPEVDLPWGLTTVYDIPISIISLILGILFTTGSIQNAIALAKLEE